MFRSSPFRFAAVALLCTGFFVPSARAESKDMIQLQTQVQNLMDAVARLQQSNDERMGVMKDLVQQTADSVNKMSVEVNGMKLGMQNHQDALAAKSDQLSGQVQSLNDSLDELKARMARMEKVLGDVQNQQQSANSILNNLPQGGGAPAIPVTSAPNGRQTAPIPDQGPAPITRGGPGASAAPSSAPAAGNPPVADMYRSAYSDYMAAKYTLAATEFSDLIKAYPDDNLSGNAYFYMGEIDLRTQKLSAAVKNYDHLLERYPDNNKIPAAHLHKAEAMLGQKQTDGGIRELRSLIQRFPNSPESAQARTKLAALHVSAAPRDAQ
jgi:tol-pal system protein YbgF